MLYVYIWTFRTYHVRNLWILFPLINVHVQSTDPLLFHFTKHNFKLLNVGDWNITPTTLPLSSILSLLWPLVNHYLYKNTSKVYLALSIPMQVHVNSFTNCLVSIDAIHHPQGISSYITHWLLDNYLWMIWWYFMWQVTLDPYCSNWYNGLY